MASSGGAIYPQETAKALRDVPRSAWECTVISYVYLFFLPKNLTSSQKELLRQFAASMGDLDGESGKSIFGKKKR